MAFRLRMAMRLDFMAALRSSAAFSEKEDGVLEGVALPRVARDEAHLAAKVFRSLGFECGVVGKGVAKH